MSDSGTDGQTDGRTDGRWHIARYSIQYMLVARFNEGAGFASEASEKKFSRPLLGGPEKLQADCLVVTNSANCFLLFIVNSTKLFVKPVVTTVYLVYN